MGAGPHAGRRRLRRGARGTGARHRPPLRGQGHPEQLRRRRRQRRAGMGQRRQGCERGSRRGGGRGRRPLARRVPRGAGPAPRARQAPQRGGADRRVCGRHQPLPGPGARGLGPQGAARARRAVRMRRQTHLARDCARSRLLPPPRPCPPRRQAGQRAVVVQWLGQAHRLWARTESRATRDGARRQAQPPGCDALVPRSRAPLRIEELRQQGRLFCPRRCACRNASRLPGVCRRQRR
mmetsp:Transcript_1880/g.5702  ORF Transcript_1880/g.5702 Transcript_1880/m.5702 type:complete len:237 (+) Transcript_1880:91-801(+)